MKKTLIEPNWKRELKAVQNLPDDDPTKIMLARIEQLVKGFYSAKNPPVFENYERHSDYVSRLTMAIYKEIKK